MYPSMARSAFQSPHRSRACAARGISGFAGKMREDMAEDCESHAAVRGSLMYKRKHSSGGDLAPAERSAGGTMAAADDSLATPAHAHTAAFGVGLLHGALPLSVARCTNAAEREWTGWAHTGGGNALAFKQPT